MSDFEPHRPNPDPDPAPERSGGIRHRPLAGGLTAAAMVLAAVGLTLTTGSSPSGAAVATASTTRNGTTGQQSRPRTDARRKGIIGTVTATDATTLRVEARPKRLPRRGANAEGESTRSGAPGSKADPGATKDFTVTTTDATKVIESTDGAVADLTEGDTVVVAGRSSEGTVAARRIIQTERELTPGGRRGPNRPPEDNAGPPQKGAHQDRAHHGRRPLLRRLTFGTVTSVDGSTVTIRTASGDTVKVTTTSATAVEVTEHVDFSSIETGDTVRVIGKVSGTKVAATTIVVGDESVFGPGGRPGCPGPGGPPSTDN